MTHNKILLQAKSKLNSKEALISKALINLNISHEECVLINNVLKECGDMKKKSKIKKLDQLIKTFNILIKQCYLII